MPHPLFFLFFSGAITGNLVPQPQITPPTDAIESTGTAPLKNKKKGLFPSVPIYKQATPTGFNGGTPSNLSNAGPSKMWRMTSVETLGYYRLSLRDNSFRGFVA